MALTPGTKLGPYEIQPLGAGGMGEVYRARDTRLDRTVAVKILPSHLSENPGAKQRFDREARAISSLNHPNICTLYDVGHQEGVDYLVMEFLEGETLADRLMKGPLPMDQVLKYGIEICEGLESAHKTGVTHRDLKPGNIMLTKSGLRPDRRSRYKRQSRTDEAKRRTSLPADRKEVSRGLPPVLLQTLTEELPFLRLEVGDSIEGERSPRLHDQPQLLQ
jgi:serine/threonine protein kinase